jgi:predicted Holliday junction resolvase-like endonuclease
MSAGRAVSRNVAVVLGIVCALLVVTVAVDRDTISTLNSHIQLLKGQVADMESQVSSLKLQAADLRDKYTSLKSEYDKLKRDYDKLLSAMERGEAVARSATWLSEDRRLKVTSEVIPKLLFGELFSYDVKVTVTNVGAEPLDVVWIFLFPYRDGKVAGYWSEVAYSKKVESLYVGESYSYTFEYIPKEMTTYRVLAVAG